MRLKASEEFETPRRYDADTLREVTALAQELQRAGGSTLTADEIEAIGEEAGLGRPFMREALRQLMARKSQHSERLERIRDVRGLALGWGAVGTYAFFAWALGALFPGLIAPLTLMGAPVVCAAVGMLMGKGRPAAVAGAALGLMLAGMYGGLSQGVEYGWKLSMLYAVGATPVGALIAGQVGKIRDQFTKSTLEDSSPSSELLDLLVTLQRQLRQQTRTVTYVSLKVHGIEELRQSAGEPRTAATLEELRRWVQEIGERNGGAPVGADALLFRFDTEAGAVRAARELHDGTTRFNSDRSLLQSPLRISCGIAACPAGASETSASPNEPLLAARASALAVQADAGDVLVSGEVAAAALLELGVLAPASRTAGEDPAFSWRAGQRVQRRP